MVDDLFYFNSESNEFIILSVILSACYFIIIVLAIFKIISPPSAYYKKSVILLLLMIILISICNYYLVRIIRSLQFLLLFSKKIIDLIALCPIFMYFYIFAVISHIIFDLHISLSDINNQKKAKGSKMFKIFLSIAVFLSTLIVSFIILIEIYNWFIFLYVEIVIQALVTILLTLNLLSFSVYCLKVGKTINQFFMREFGKEITKNIRFIITIYLISTIVCIILFNISFYSFLLNIDEKLR